MRAVALLLVALVLAGCAAPAEAPTPKYPTYPNGQDPSYPEAYRNASARWLGEAEANLSPHAGRPWHAENAAFLEKARGEVAAGLVRSSMFDLATTEELLRANLLMDEAEPLGSDAERKSFVLERTSEWAREANASWEAFRADLHRLDGEVRSLHAIEAALYAADVAIGAKLALDTHDEIARELPKTPDFVREAVLDVVRASWTPQVDLHYAQDLLAIARGYEGLPPEANRTRFDEQLRVVLAPVQDETGRLAAWESFAPSVRENDEGLLAMAIYTAERRAERLQSISLTFGDARTRGLDVVNDANKFMGVRLNRTSLDDVRAHGLQGVFTASAVDHARFVKDLAAQNKTDLGILMNAWANLDHQEIVAVVLAQISPVDPGRETSLGKQIDPVNYLTPTVPTRRGAPGFEAAAVALALGGAVLVGRRRA